MTASVVVRGLPFETDGTRRHLAHLQSAGGRLGLACEGGGWALRYVYVELDERQNGKLLRRDWERNSK